MHRHKHLTSAPTIISHVLAGLQLSFEVTTQTPLFSSCWELLGCFQPYELVYLFITVAGEIDTQSRANRKHSSKLPYGTEWRKRPTSHIDEGCVRVALTSVLLTVMLHLALTFGNNTCGFPL